MNGTDTPMEEPNERYWFMVYLGTYPKDSPFPEGVDVPPAHGPYYGNMSLVSTGGSGFPFAEALSHIKSAYDAGSILWYRELTPAEYEAHGRALKIEQDAAKVPSEKGTRYRVVVSPADESRADAELLVADIHKFTKRANPLDEPTVYVEKSTDEGANWVRDL